MTKWSLEIIYSNDIFYISLRLFYLAVKSKSDKYDSCQQNTLKSQPGQP